MYIKSISIQNIRSIEKLEMEFPTDNYPGWHVVLGDNGAGKSTFIRAVAVALIGSDDAKGLRQDWASWLTRSYNFGGIGILLSFDKELDSKKTFTEETLIPRQINFHRDGDEIIFDHDQSIEISKKYYSASFGPFRRFTGGNREWEILFKSSPKVARHLSAFGEDVALTEALDWLQKLSHKQLEKDKEASFILSNLKKFVNTGSLLPHKSELSKINSDGVFFRDGNGVHISVTELSDGYRSILSMTFEIIRQLVSAYGAETVFEHIQKGEALINVPGVIMIDEVDAHLHPTWQTRIGQWFTRYFPKMQFIVTTHSPLICRGAEKGTIWRLPAPGSGEQVEQITGAEKDKLVYGNVLDAYSTDAFGVNIARSDKSQEMLERLSKLNMKATFEDLSEKEKTEQAHLQKIFISDDTLEL